MKVKSFQVGGFGEVYLLTEDGKMYQGEFQNIETESVDSSHQSDMKIIITRQILLPDIIN